MPIRLPANLPAFKILSEEGVMMMSEDSAERQDIRPLEIALLNLMPEKEKTERQFARLIGSTPLQVKLTLVKITNHKPKNTLSNVIIKRVLKVLQIKIIYLIALLGSKKTKNMKKLDA